MDTEQGGPSSVVSTGKLRPSKYRAWSRSASRPGWSLSSVCINCRPLFFGDLRVSTEERRERRERVSCGGMLPQGRPAPAQDGGGGSLQNKGGEPGSMHMLRRFPWQLSPQQLRKTPDPPSWLAPAMSVLYCPWGRHPHSQDLTWLSPQPHLRAGHPASYLVPKEG